MGKGARGGGAARKGGTNGHTPPTTPSKEELKARLAKRRTTTSRMSMSLSLLGATVLVAGIAAAVLYSSVQGGHVYDLLDLGSTYVFDGPAGRSTGHPGRNRAAKCTKGFHTWLENEPGEQGGTWPDAWNEYTHDNGTELYYNEMTGATTSTMPASLARDEGDPDRPHELLGRQYRTYKWSIESDWARFYDNSHNLGPITAMCAKIEPDGERGVNTQRVLTTLTLGPWASSQARATTAKNWVEDDVDEWEETEGVCIDKVQGPEHTAVPARSISKTFASAAFLAVSERSLSYGGLGLGAGTPLTLETKVGKTFGNCGRVENATVLDLLAMRTLDNRNYGMWKYYGHVMDNLGFPAECDARQMDVVRCVTEVVCPAFEQCLTSGDDDYDTAYESVQDSQDLPMSLYATREQRRKKEIAYDNYAYTLVDALVKRRTGLPLYYWLKELILRPLGMSQALRCMSGRLHEGGRPGCFGTPYLTLACGEDDEPERECEPMERPTRASEDSTSDLGINWPKWKGEQLTVNWLSNAVMSSPRDMLRFTSMLAGNGTIDGVRILSKESVKAIFTDYNICDTFQMGHFGLGVTSCRAEMCGARPPPGKHHATMPLTEDGGAQYIPGQWFGMGGSYGTKFIVLPDQGVTCLHMAMIPAKAVAGDRISAKAHFLWRLLGKEMREMWP